MKTYFGFNLIVSDVLEHMTVEEAVEVRGTKEKDLILFHHTAGQHIRNKYKLWDEKNPFTKNYEGCEDSDFHADQFSNRVIKKVWDELTFKPQNGEYDNDES